MCTHTHTHRLWKLAALRSHSLSHCMAYGSSTSLSLSFPTSHVMLGEHMLKNLFFKEEAKPTDVLRRPGSSWGDSSEGGKAGAGL